VSDLEQLLTEKFVCARCGQQMARVKTLAMSGRGLTRILDLQPYKYLFVTCENCGYTKVYDPQVLKEKENPAELFETIFSRRR
jgi:predicted nucleic-acid-binding Zn-ribbon protein